MNTLESYSILSPFDSIEICGLFTIDDPTDPYVLAKTMIAEQKYALSFWVRSDTPGHVVVESEEFESGDVWRRHVKLFEAAAVDLEFSFKETGKYYIYHPKLETGNIATDWDPSPEDVDESLTEIGQNADDALDQSENAVNRVGAAESMITQLSNSISSLVTDANGSSLMTQTSTGWTFNIGAMQSTLNKATSDIQDIKGDSEEIKNIADQAKDIADDVAEKTAYINMTTVDDQPCLELGKQGNPFRIRITNTSIDFMQNEERIAYITNRQLYIQSSVVTDEMKIGDANGYVWKRRGSGHMGLRYESRT